ncbi:hypothetical protein [Actinomadura sp. 6N118]|uniref:hypothetical protein n=1 Tax=Actinomadura sp. 6N118 TaxID=3375151 RepID=UPI003789C5D9
MKHCGQPLVPGTGAGLARSTGLDRGGRHMTVVGVGQLQALDQRLMTFDELAATGPRRAAAWRGR